MNSKLYLAIASLLLYTISNIAFANPVGQLPNGYYVSAKMPMTAVHPRPDSETNDWARHRKAYADGTVQYRIPVSVQGGAYPFIYELMSGPSGMTIGNTISNGDYGVVTWTPGTGGGPYNVSVKVTDQDQNTLTVNWSVTATTSGFIFVDPNVSTSGTGTKANPLKTFADVHKGSTADTSYTGQILYLRAGTHVLSGPESNGNLQLENNNKPAVWLGYPGEDVIVNFNQSKILVDNQHDVFVSGIRMTEARNDVNNAHFWFFNQNTAQKRVTFFEVDFDNINRGLTGSDNPAAITFFNPGTLREYFTLMGCTYNDYASPLVDAYAIKYGVIDNNQLLVGKTSSINQGIFLKSDVQNFSVRRNTSLAQTFAYGALEVMMQAQSFANDNIEIAYNQIREPSKSSSKRAIVYNWNTGKGNNVNPAIFVYRNTLIGEIAGLDSFPYTVTIENNVVLSNNGIQSSGANRTIVASGNITGSHSSGITDADGNLAGSNTQYFGTRGHAISTGIIPLSYPTWR